MARLARAMGGEAETVAGLSGLGDLVLTATDAKSRNYAFGLALGRGRTVEEALAEASGVVEGVATATALRGLAAARGVEMPISEAVARVLAGEVALDQAIEALLARPLVAEAEADRLPAKASSPRR